MNWAHVHLMINHVPVIGLPGAAALLIYSLLKKSDEIERVSFGLFVLIAVMTLAVFFTGQAAANVVKDLPGVTETYIGRHEEMADLSLVLIEVLGALCLAGLFLARRSGSIPKLVVVPVLVLSLATAAVVGLTANLGGQIRHQETREGFVPPRPSGPAQ
jgi:uncharacterized membrane protein